MSAPYPVKQVHKAYVERRRLYLDYSCWLAETEKLNGFQVIVDPYTADAPIIVNAAYTDAEQKKLVTFVSGGVPNTTYALAMIVQTDAGQIKRDIIGILVTP